VSTGSLPGPASALEISLHAAADSSSAALLFASLPERSPEASQSRGACRFHKRTSGSGSLSMRLLESNRESTFANLSRPPLPDSFDRNLRSTAGELTRSGGYNCDQLEKVAMARFCVSAGAEGPGDLAAAGNRASNYPYRDAKGQARCDSQALRPEGLKPKATEYPTTPYDSWREEIAGTCPELRAREDSKLESLFEQASAKVRGRLRFKSWR
jgi:hypothetical protein